MFYEWLILCQSFMYLHVYIMSVTIAYFGSHIYKFVHIDVIILILIALL